MPELNIDVQGEGLKYVQEIAAKIEPETAKKLQKWLYRIEASAKKNASEKPEVDTGRLRSSIANELRSQGGEIVGVVGTNVFYARYVEEGTRRHFVPFSVAPGLLRWARRKGMDTDKMGFRIRGNWVPGMIVSGKAQPFLQPAYDEHKDGVIRDFDNLVPEVKGE